jgi:hypothetical protein
MQYYLALANIASLNLIAILAKGLARKELARK